MVERCIVCIFEYTKTEKLNVMNYQVKVLELVTELGTFTFTNHHNSEANLYQAMLNFESNNWEMLGDYYYTATLRFEDDTNTTEIYKGINASCEVSDLFDSEFATDLEEMYAREH